MSVVALGPATSVVAFLIVGGVIVVVISDLPGVVGIVVAWNAGLIETDSEPTWAAEVGMFAPVALRTTAILSCVAWREENTKSV